jgi:hypothetical protein
MSVDCALTQAVEPPEPPCAVCRDRNAEEQAELVVATRQQRDRRLQHRDVVNQREGDLATNSADPRTLCQEGRRRNGLVGGVYLLDGPGDGVGVLRPASIRASTGSRAGGRGSGG